MIKLQHMVLFIFIAGVYLSVANELSSNGTYDMNVTARSTYAECGRIETPYRGTVNFTISGKKCQRWDQQFPHKHDYANFPDAVDNYCRKHDEDIPWCYTILQGLRSEVCSIPMCGNSSIVCRIPGFLYTGSINVTKSGRPCQRWDTQTPHEHTYDNFGHARENYCRNFDREEPWCFTNDSNVRWELCDVDICETPCLNESTYTQKEVLPYCINNLPSIRNCSSLQDLLACLKQRVENVTNVNCPEIQLKSIALQIRKVIEKTLGWTIDDCILSACSMKQEPQILSGIQAISKYVNPCNHRILVQDSTKENFCRNVQRLMHCSISLLNWQYRSTCLVEDKLDLLNNFKFLTPAGFDIDQCVTGFLSEFPIPIKNEIEGTDTDKSQTQAFLAIGFAVGITFIISLTIGIIKRRTAFLKKKRKEMMRPSNAEMSDGPPYVSNFTFPGQYLDPDYEFIEEEDTGYERLSGQLGESDGRYTVPNNADGAYLNAVHVEDNDQLDFHPYLDLVDGAIDSVPTRVDEGSFKLENSQDPKSLKIAGNDDAEILRTEDNESKNSEDPETITPSKDEEIKNSENLQPIITSEDEEIKNSEDAEILTKSGDEEIK